jgi:hypothetical protein
MRILIHDAWWQARNAAGLYDAKPQSNALGRRIMMQKMLLGCLEQLQTNLFNVSSSPIITRMGTCTTANGALKEVIEEMQIICKQHICLLPAGNRNSILIIT